MTCLDASTLTAAPDEHAVGRALRRLKARAGTHSPSVTEIERALPGAVRVDACFLSNPYATDEVMSRIATIPRDRLEQRPRRARLWVLPAM